MDITSSIGTTSRKLLLCSSPTNSLASLVVQQLLDERTVE
jgi:hypothetical protein